MSSPFFLYGEEGIEGVEKEIKAYVDNTVNLNITGFQKVFNQKK